MKYADSENQFVIHPDMIGAYKNYGRLKGAAFQQVFNARKELAKQGLPYHNTLHDVELRETAIERTAQFAAEGNKWPVKNRRS